MPTKRRVDERTTTRQYFTWDGQGSGSQRKWRMTLSVCFFFKRRHYGPPMSPSGGAPRPPTARSQHTAQSGNNLHNWLDQKVSQYVPANISFMRIHTTNVRLRGFYHRFHQTFYILRNQGRYSFPTAVGHGFSSPRPYSVRTYLSMEMIELLRELVAQGTSPARSAVLACTL